MKALLEQASTGRAKRKAKGADERQALEAEAQKDVATALDELLEWDTKSLKSTLVLK